MRKSILFLLWVLCSKMLFAQKTIVFEKMRCFSGPGPVMKYFENEEIKKTVAVQLNQNLQKHLQLSLADTNSITPELLQNAANLKSIAPAFTDADTMKLHLYIDFFEMTPSVFFSYIDNTITDTAMKQRVKTVFSIEAWLLTSDKKIFLHEQLNIAVSSAESPGIGTLYNNSVRFGSLSVTPKGFTELVRFAGNTLFDPKNEMATMEIKVAPVYIADNYILPKVTNQQRTYVSTTKNISTYIYQGKGEMIRMGDGMYEEMKLKGKKTEAYPEDITSAIKQTDNFSISDYVFLKQETRDVARDKNYLVKLCTQIDPDNPPLMGRQYAFTNFLKGDFHYLFLEKDTLAKFSISKMISDKKDPNRFYPDKISNGYDSSSVFRINAPQPEAPVLYDYIVNGKISRQDFQVKCSGFGNLVKEIFLDKKLVCIAQGKFNPEKFVVFDASLSSELLNQLFMIGFNRFFE